VLPRWAGSALATADPAEVRHVVTIGTQQPTERVRTARLFANTAKVLCAGCNNGWMSRLETDARQAMLPMIWGESAVLDRDTQRTLAAWAVKTAIVADHAQSYGWEPSPMEAERHHLAEFGEPTGTVLVWLASRLNPPPAQMYLWGGTATPAASGEPDPYVIYGATIALGPIAFQVVYATIPQLPVAWELDERPAINLIWPYRAPVDWDERASFAAQDFDGYIEALPSIVRGIGTGAL
jgi:hypothetical protein